MLPPSLRADADLAPLTTLGVAARAAWLAEPATVEALLDCLRWAEKEAAPVLLLGGGSNLVFAADWKGLVLRPALRGRERVAETADHVLLRVAAGENWHDTVDWSLAQGWPGLENLALIPGSVGAAPIQNIGAYGLEVADRLHSVEVLDRRSGAIRQIARSECRFGYRDSIFKHEEGRDLIVLAVTFVLPRNWSPLTGYRDLREELLARGIAEPEPRAVFEAVVSVRRRKLPDPAVTGNVGSFFKNPVVGSAQYHALREREPELVAYPLPDGSFKLAAGWLIDRAGWKGRSLGGAAVHAAQALVLTNRGSATGTEILLLAQAIRDDIGARFDVTLEIEPVIIQ